MSQALYTALEARALRTTSGPMPAGSPRVTPIKGLGALRFDFDVGFRARFIEVFDELFGGSRLKELHAGPHARLVARIGAGLARHFVLADLDAGKDHLA